MQYVGRLMSTVYNSITPNINPATLSGAIDIIVVEREVKKPRDPNGDPNDVEVTTELASTPFHVRFGKMSVLRPGERKVTLHLNGAAEPLPFHMKVGETGEAFFVLEVDEEDSDAIPDALVTSPLLSAASSPSATPSFGGPEDSSQDEGAYDVEPLDLGAAAVSSVEIQATRAATQAAVARSQQAEIARSTAGLTNLSLDDPEADSEVRSATASSQQTAVDSSTTSAVPVSSKELDIMLDMDGYKVTGEAGQDHRHHHFSKMLRRAAQKADEEEAQADDELRREAEVFFGGRRSGSTGSKSGGSHSRTLSSPLQAALDLANGPSKPFRPFESQSRRSRRASFSIGTEDSDSDNTRASAAEIARELKAVSAARRGGEDPGNTSPRSDSVAFVSSDTQQEPEEVNGEELTHRLLARAKSDPAIDVSAVGDGHETAEKIMEEVIRGPAASLRSRQVLIETKASKKFIKTLRLSSDQLKSLNLKKGMNTISFSVTSSYSGVATCTARIFLWQSNFQVVVSDIDGTITKSDALGHVFNMIGRDWTHLGVAKLYTDVARNGYHVMYLTSRAIGQADTTRDYLKNINQNGYRLPEGPVIMSPDRLITSLHREVILRKPEVFKMACLRDIARLFGCDFRGGPSGTSHQANSSGALAPPTSAQTVGAELRGQDLESAAATGANNAQHSSTPTPFFAGFGNRITDALSYRSVNVPSSRIFTIDWNGQVKMELLDTAGYNTSYVNMNELVDQFFPVIQAAEVSHPRQREYNDVNYWRAPIVEFDLPPMEDLSPPVSPALSARSGRSIRSTISIRSSVSKRSATAAAVLDSEERNGSGTNGANGGAGPSSPTSGATRLSRFGLSSLGLGRRGSNATSDAKAARAATLQPSSSVPATESLSELERGNGKGGKAGGIAFPESVPPPDLLMDDDDPLLAQGEVRFDWK
ncbi:lipin Ned1 [Tilletia horrida]|nr:lipin Ned1 [Tilletia horrida]